MPVDRTDCNNKASSSRSRLPYCKTNTYGGSAHSSRDIVFAPNVTPITFYEAEAGARLPSVHASPSDALCTLVKAPAATASRRREPPSKRRLEGHIPRPPNAFILFRSAFIKREYVPGFIQEGNVPLSKMIGNYWKALLPEEKQVWEEKAQVAKKEHAEMYPDYQFRPVHDKEKKAAKRRAKASIAVEEEHHLDEATQPSLEGKKDEARRRDIKRQRVAANTPEAFSSIDEWAMPPPDHQPAPFHGDHRRSSSMPVPWQRYNPIMLPKLPFLVGSSQSPAGSRVPSPIGNISRAQRNTTARRSSSMQAAPRPSWTQPADLHLPMHMPAPVPMPPSWQHDWLPVPELDVSLFEPAYTQNGSHFSQMQKDYAFPMCEPAQQQSLSLAIDPLDCGPLGLQGFIDMPTSALSSAPSTLSVFPFHAPFSNGPMLDAATGSNGSMPMSGSTSAISASPAPSNHSPSYALNVALLAQQLQAQVQEQPFDSWMPQGQMLEHASQQQYIFGGGNDFAAQMGPHHYMGHTPQPDLLMIQSSGLQPCTTVGSPVDQYAGGMEYAGDFADDVFGLGLGASAQMPGY